MINDLGTVDLIEEILILFDGSFDILTGSTLNGVIPIDRAVEYILCRGDKVGVLLADKRIGQTAAGLNSLEEVGTVVGRKVCG